MPTYLRKDFRMITRFTSPKVKEPAPKLWSNCIVCDGVAYISGLTSRGDDGVTIIGLDEYEQSKIIFEIMAIKYLKKSPKTPSTDDSKTAEIVKKLLINDKSLN